MQLIKITIHNFRSIATGTFNVGDYSLLIGANNSGKSNIMDALRIFYEKGIKFEESRDFPKFETDDDESWIEIEYILDNDEYKNLKEEYKQPNNSLKVRKYFLTNQKDSKGKHKLGIYAYIQNSISDEHFYGAKNVQQGKLGEIIYIPAVSKLDEHTKLSGPSALRELLNDIVKKLVKSSVAFKNLTGQFETFTAEFKTEETDDNKSLSGLETEINAYIQDWEVEFELDISPVTEVDIIKNLVSYKIIDSVLDERFEAGQFGQGFQRHLIFTLIQMSAKYQTTAHPSDKKEFSPNMTLLLFEEPEAFLHPTQQSILCHSLKGIATQEGNQVLLSSHSPHFVSHNSDDIPSIIRLCNHKGKTVIGQIKYEDLNRIFTSNLEINDIVRGTRFEADSDDLKEDMEALKYFMWLDTERCGMFFAKQILMVEGPTERVLLNHLFHKGVIEMPRGGVFVLDCFGKFNIHRFMNILGPLNVNHSILLDGDNGKPPHDKILELIEDSRNSLTRNIEVFPDNVETFLGIEKCNKSHRKPQHMMLKLEEGTIKSERIDALIEIVNKLIQL
ncbi:MAG: AAA family ATPase [Gammaproteobacteria bacterium]|nr:AAA family ATPase [Gammaproteobacteria bacterium]